MHNRWTMVLGKQGLKDDEVNLSIEEKAMEELLTQVYSVERAAGIGKTQHSIKRWLDGIRTYFPPGVIRLLQQDALERQGVKEMLLEPELLEKIEPNINMVATILTLQELLPDKTKAVAKILIRKLVEETSKKLKPKLSNAIQSALTGRSKAINPQHAKIDWKRTIGSNLKHYQKSSKKVIPERWYGYHKGNQLPEIVLLIDKSESMINSAIYASIIGSILASLKSIKTHLIFFDTSITDVSGLYKDPVDILFSVPMGGGTDIGLALNYVHQKIKSHSKTILFLISDLDDGGKHKDLFGICSVLLQLGLKMHCILALDDEGKPDYNVSVGQKLANMGLPVFSCAPSEFPEILAKEINKISS